MTDAELEANCLNSHALAALKKSGAWMVRMSNGGRGHNGFAWQPIGEWTKAPDWTEVAECSGGLFGQGPGAGEHGYCKEGDRFELCETRGKRISVEGTKIKAPEARIVAVDAMAFDALVKLCDGRFPGALNLSLYPHPLPATLTSVGGDLDLEGYAHPLPAGLAD